MNKDKKINLEGLVGKQIGTATLVRELAKGGMGTVFIAYQRTLKRQIAVKVLPKILLDETATDLFYQEAESAAILSHPNIIQIYEIGDTDAFLYFTMQLVDGRPLSNYLTSIKKHVIPSKRFLPLRTTFKLITGILEALEYAHQQETVHRDIKPGNILVERHSNRPIITDFGISKSLRGPDAVGQRVMGTPIYISPEQILSKPVDGRADIYATGVMLFEMLVTSLPMATRRSAAQLIKLKMAGRQFSKTPSQINPLLEEPIDGIISKALALRPENRYATCKEFLADLESYAAQYLS